MIRQSRRSDHPIRRCLRGAALVATLALGATLASPAVALGPGDKAPDFSLERLDGKGKVSLSQFKGKVVWLDFWASWCAPCLKALPELEEMRGRLPAKKVQILAINLDEDIARANKFLAKHPIGYPSASDPKGTMPELFGVKNMPTSLLIDAKGVVRHVHKGFRAGDIEDIEAMIRKEIGGK